MGLLTTEQDWDWTLHNLDGTHRQSAPTTEPERQDRWRAQLDRHVAAHIVEAKKANEPLRIGGDADLADLADKAAEVTQGAVYYAYTTIPDKKYYYVFHGIDGKADRVDIIKELHLAINRVPGM